MCQLCTFLSPVVTRKLWIVTRLSVPRERTLSVPAGNHVGFWTRKAPRLLRVRRGRFAHCPLPLYLHQQKVPSSLATPCAVALGGVIISPVKQRWYDRAPAHKIRTTAKKTAISRKRKKTACTARKRGSHLAGDNAGGDGDTSGERLSHGSHCDVDVFIWCDGRQRHTE